MVKSINLHKIGSKLILGSIICLILFQIILPFINADDLANGPLEISTPQKSFKVNIGDTLTISWSFSVPSHEYAVYWEILGNGINKTGWGLNANCTTPAITTNGTTWIYNCSGYYAKYHVWCTVSVLGVSGRDNNGIDGIYSQKIGSNAITQWITDGQAICRASGDQYNPQIISDGAGGAIITWEESDIYAQKINSNGDIQWDLNGKTICTISGNQIYPQLVSDGAGGAIITWQDNRNGNDDIYVQKVNSSGDIQWTGDGIEICTVDGSQKYPQIVSDEVGGVIIAWQDDRDGNTDIYAQKINSSGDTQWTANGTAICTKNGTQNRHRLISDGMNGTIITWQDARTGDFDIYAQKINSSGDIQWTANGSAICTIDGSQLNPQLVSNGINGTIITWQDTRTGASDIYIQKVNSSGDIQWNANGIAICTTNGDQQSPQLINDGINGSIITWQDSRTGTLDIFAQRINSSGESQWIANGTAICTAIGSQSAPKLVSDGINGTIITWQDNRNGEDDIYAQKVNSKGESQWIANGIAVCKANGNQLIPQIVSDGAGGAIIVWDDNRFEEDGGDGGNGGDGGDDGYNNPYDVPGFSPAIFIIIFSISMILKIIIFHSKLKTKNSKNKTLTR